jgi:hypothetical protein
LRNIEARIEDFSRLLPAGCAHYQAGAVPMGWQESGVVVKTTTITIETESLLVVRRGKTVVTWCPVCCAEAEAMTLEGSSLGEDIPSTLLRDWLAAGKLHLWSLDGGLDRICLTSLLRCLESEDARRLPTPKPTPPKTGEGK